MIGPLIRTDMGGRFVQFMRTDKGKKIDKFLVRNFDFSLLMKVFSARVGFPPIPVLMIYTIGRKSGEERSVVMPYFKVDGAIYLIGSNGAKKNDPLWVENLRADPRGRAIIHRKQRRVLAREVMPGSEEYERIWQHARVATPQYATYQSSTTRKIPIMALEPTA
jgi:deazaflavin-dependent oxidoreductase (nitroreductase family)